MIARAPYLFLLLIIVPDLYFDLHYWRHKFSTSKRLLYWIPTIVMVGLTLKLTYEPEFIPEDTTLIFSYLLMLGLISVPKMVYMLCSIAGLATSKVVRLFKRNKRHKPKNYGNLAGWLATVLIWYAVLYGTLVGFYKLNTDKTHYYISTNIPATFDGYKIVQFSDLHVGTMKGDRQWMLKRLVDSINAQKPDLIVFTGDLQNVRPKDLYDHKELLSSLKAKDGVYSVLGNHDYDKYMHPTDDREVKRCKETIALEKSFGWHVLLNDHRTISRGNEHITIAGMENDGDGKVFPEFGDINKTLNGVKGFTIMLAHNPIAWRKKIIPDGRAELTLSGHTHAMQFNFFGWNPIALLGKEWYGWYKEGGQSLYVTSGAGALIPWRFGSTAEIMVIELRSHL